MITSDTIWKEIQVKFVLPHHLLKFLMTKRKQKIILWKQNCLQQATKDPKLNSGKIVFVFSKKYKREMAMQLILYSLTFIATYGMFAVASFISGFGEPFPFVVYLQVMFPLQGLFTIIIFLRPASCVTKHKLESKSWMKAFWIVFKNGGVSPSDSRNNTEVLFPVEKVKKRNQSVKFGIANEQNHALRSDIFSHFTSEKFVMFYSNSEMSEGNACYNSKKNWTYVKLDGTLKKGEEKVASNSACSQNGDSSSPGSDSPGLTMDVEENI